MMPGSLVMPRSLIDFKVGDGTPRLTAREAGFYIVCETLYFNPPDADPWEKYFKVL